MLSIVLYGRNDNYGYNLHKRAAISINCMTEILDSPDDEILFVDYNTPDDLPTFTEAIQDTLTPKAKKHLRTLRVRPEVHQRFAKLTHLVALEPVARNVAIRRANPNNRWILSTNTDMIFIPRTRDPLSRTLRYLDDGAYGLPRFEIPETLWEGFDRAKPDKIFESVRYWSKQANLNEIVYGSDDILYDAPGDFQLFPRQTMFDINGFDEEMILGWHVDSNIAKRFRLKFGPPRTLLDKYFGYHCDHTRMSTPMHRRERVQNDLKRFVDNLTVAELPEQADSWGCPDARIEEVRLTDGPSTYALALQKHIEPAREEYTEVGYRPETYDVATYSPHHVLPFLIDLFAALPRHWNVGWAGTSATTLKIFAGAWKEMQFTGKILLRDSCRDIAGKTAPEGVDIVGRDEFLEKSDTYVFEVDTPVGMMANSATEARHLALAYHVRAAFLDTVNHERARSPDETMRRFAFVNAIHTRFEDVVTKNLAVTITPFSSRIRHGYVYREEGKAGGRGSTRQPGRTEATKLADMIDMALDAEDGSLAWQSAAKSAALLLANRERLEEGRRAKRDPQRFQALMEYFQQERLSARIVPVDAVLTDDSDPVEDPAVRGISRIAEFYDWDYPTFLQHVDAIVDGMERAVWNQRSAWLWERAQMLLGSSRLGALDESKKALYLAYCPDRLLAALSDKMGKVDILRLEVNNTTDSRSSLVDRWHANFEKLNLLPESVNLAELVSDEYDLVALPHNCAAIYGPHAFVNMLIETARVAKSGGTIAIAAEITIGRAVSAACGRWTVPVNAEFWNKVRAVTGLELVDGFDSAVSRGTVDRAWEGTKPIPGENYFVSRQADIYFGNATFFLKKSEQKRPTAKDRAELAAYATEPAAGSSEIVLRNGDVVHSADLAQLKEIAAGDDREALSRYAYPIVDLASRKDAAALLGKETAKLAREIANAPHGGFGSVAVVEKTAAPSAAPASRLAEISDWADANWRAAARRVGEFRDGASLFARSAQTWEHAQTIYGLSRAGMLEPGKKGLVVASEPDTLFGALTESGGAVTLVDLSRHPQANPISAWTKYRGNGERLTVLRAMPQSERSLDFAVATRTAAARLGVAGLSLWLGNVSRLLKPGGIAAFAAPVALEPPSGDRQDIGPAAMAELAKLAGLELDGPPAMEITAATAARVPVRGRPLTDDMLLRDGGGRLHLPTVWFFKASGAAEVDERGLLTFASRAFATEKLPLAKLGAGAIREGSRIVAGRSQGHAVFGPYEVGIPGRYVARFELTDISPRGGLEVMAEVTAGQIFLGQKGASFSRLTESAVLECQFEVPAGETEAHLEYRVWSNGQGEFRIASISVSVA